MVFFVVRGSLEYVNEYGETNEIEDWRTVAERYYRWCDENGIEKIDLTHPRGKAPDKVFKKRGEKTDL